MLIQHSNSIQQQVNIHSPQNKYIGIYLAFIKCVNIIIYYILNVFINLASQSVSC